MFIFQKETIMTVMKSVQIMSESSKSFEGAIETAVARMSKSVKNIRSANIQNQSVTIKDNKIDMFRVNLMITFEVGGKEKSSKSSAKPKVIYTDGPTDGTPDDLKVIKGIGPKFEGDLNSKGIYYYRQIANWSAADVTMVEGIIDSIPGRIQRDEWVNQAKKLSS